MSSRLPFWEGVRGICILAVILIHSTMNFNYIAPDEEYVINWIVLRKVIDFPVAVFIFLSGLFAKSAKLFNLNHQSNWNWIKKRGGGCCCPIAYGFVFIC